ncbi:MBL fold metallo-hydrolase [Peristeroidobacter agariperforans]|uniref:MBL fold metallo-hydrolase n=1 Tax=Peristeroidobacter agariperforans TaxID=268404 RepID=UPI00101E1E3D|nr:MBL fold metallo-hydrolase [Peristeroidobacter agariperforans]
MPNTPVRLSFYGAAGTVTGSRYLLETGDRRILIDCGLFQGYKQLRLRNWTPLPFDAREIDAVILTHAHIDHSGFLPVLTRQGFRGPIYCSAATLELCKILLPDSAHLQEDDARFANRHGFSKHKPALPLYTQLDAHACLQQFQVVSTDARTALGEATAFTLKRAGHLLGACFVRLESRGVSVTFSGDLGRPDDLILQAPASPPATDFLVCESTYGDRTHPVIDPEAELAECLTPALARGAVVVVPAFAIGRAQSLLLQIARLKHRGQLPDVPVFLDSPMAIDASHLYRRFMDEHRLSAIDCDDMCRAATFVNTAEQSKSLSQRGGPMIIVSASGMATGGRVIHHLKAFAGDERNLILLTGFQAPGTRGASLAGGASRVRIHGEDWPVRAEVRQLQASSSHADAGEILAWLKQMPKPPRQIFITHGEPGASDTLRQRIEHQLGWAAIVPEYRQTIELTVLKWAPWH